MKVTFQVCEAIPINFLIILYDLNLHPELQMCFQFLQFSFSSPSFYYFYAFKHQLNVMILKMKMMNVYFLLFLPIHLLTLLLYVLLLKLMTINLCFMNYAFNLKFIHELLIILLFSILFLGSIAFINLYSLINLKIQNLWLKLKKKKIRMITLIMN